MRDPDPIPSDAAVTAGRRDFLRLAGGCAVAALGGATGSGGCGRPRSSQGVAVSAREIAAVLPKRKPLDLLPPDISGEGSLPDGYLKYPTRLTRAVPTKPGSSGRAIHTMSPWWGPTPPGLGRNVYLDRVNAELGVPVNPSVQDGSSYGDKLSAILGARDVPDVLCVPHWEIGRIPRFADAVRALFADLTEYLRGDAVAAFPMLATLPTTAWQYSVWGGRLSAVPFPTDGPFPLALFYRRDLANRAGLPAPHTIDELYSFGRKLTDPARGVWAFGAIFNMIQMFFKCPGSAGGWRRKKSGGLEFKYEIPEFKEALELTTRLYKDGMVHPDLVASRGADAKQLFNAARIVACEDGLGAWRGAQSEQSKVTPGFDMQPMPIFSAVGGDPLAWAGEEPIFYTFVKKGLGEGRTREILRVLDWCAAPFGSVEYELNAYGVEGLHFTRATDGSPVPTDAGRRELAGQYSYIGGRVPVVVATADVPTYVPDLFAYEKATMKYVEDDPFKGIKVTPPIIAGQAALSSEDKIGDILHSRRPVGDLPAIVQEWRNAGGDETRAFLEKTLADSGR
jgi:putative aldouronate transport system substrate-binding protein